MTVIRRCLSELEKFLRTPIRDIQVGVKHVVLLDCDCREDECQARKTVHMEVSEGWVHGNQERKSTGRTVFCKVCHTPQNDPWKAIEDARHEAINLGWGPGPRKAERVMNKRKCDVFICHAGPDKQAIAVPLYRILSRQNVHAFLDIEKLQINSATALRK